MKKLTVLLLVILNSCSDRTPSAQEIVDNAIAFSGTEALDNAKASFDFRGINYQYIMESGAFEYARTQSDTLGNEVKDVLTNEGLTRLINGDTATITEAKIAAYTSSVNSVIYFAFLPASLNDAAVKKEYVGEVTMKDQVYHKIKVTFDADGGGEDYEDVFYYWFDKEDYSMDYLAYSYNEDDGIGLRFREAFNQRSVNGVIIQDYVNYKPSDPQQDLAQIDDAFLNGDLEQLSLIVLEDMNISVNL